MMLAYFVFVVLFVGTFSAQVTIQVLSGPEAAAGQEPSCADGIRALMTAVDRAREQSYRTALAEYEAIGAFERALQPEWSTLGHVRQACEQSPALQDTLEAVEQWRYAEERAVRRDAHQVVGYRRKVREMAERHLAAAPMP